MHFRAGERETLADSIPTDRVPQILSDPKFPLIYLQIYNAMNKENIRSDLTGKSERDLPLKR
jgi:hypothetical protein